ncbi:MAG TPA: universal stress protein [Chthoniobacterales bacterium]|jgi:nucleotide-binding universal stress UspA family protein|nr:universal stress protein [Chthoniobacterales bacterium]
MRILICSDGTDPADKPVLLAGLVAAPTKAETTLLGIAETSGDDKPLRDALDAEAEKLRRFDVSPEIVVRAGEPIREILEQTKNARYDITIIGARRKTSSGPYWRSGKTYEVIKAIPTPVLLATGICETLKSFIVCTGGKKYIDAAVELTGKLAAAVGASVTLLHVMAEPPAIYADLMRLEEDVERLLRSGSELGRNLLAQKQSLEKLGILVEVRVRHGFVLDQIFADVSERGHDLIVTGSSPTRGPLGHYIMGDVTREIVNRANVPVLVARSAKNAGAPGGIWSTLKQLVASSWGEG